MIADRIGDLDLQGPVGQVLGGHQDVAVRRRVFERVVQQVVQDLVQALRVGHPRRQLAAGLQGDAEPALLRPGPDDVELLLEHGRDVDGLRPQGDVA